MSLVNEFSSYADRPNVEVSWQVTGIRQDPWAEANRIVVEEAKPAAEQGYYLHPALYGQPPSVASNGRVILRGCAR